MRQQRERLRAREGLKTGNAALATRKRLLPALNFGMEFRMGADVIKHGGLDPAEAEVVGIALEFDSAERTGA